jgi:hypothetical protein
MNWHKSIRGFVLWGCVAVIGGLGAAIATLDIILHGVAMSWILITGLVALAALIIIVGLAVWAEEDE